MTRPRWSGRGMLQNTNAARDPREVRSTNRSFLLGLLVGVVLAVRQFLTDNSDDTLWLRLAAATGVLIFVTIFAFLIIDSVLRLYYKVKLRRR